MSEVQSRRLSSESEYYGYLDYSEEQYSDYYRGNIMENSLESHEENGVYLTVQVTNLIIVQYFKRMEMRPVNFNLPCVYQSSFWSYF